MFYEAKDNCNLKFKDLNTDYMYSFVLQHPENRIVVKFEKPNLVLVEIKKSYGTRVEILNIHTDEFNYLRDIVTFPKILYYYNSWNNLLHQMTQSTLHYMILGCIIKCKDGTKRAKIRNPNYERVRNLRGNNPKLQFQYYNLRKMGRVKEYLYYFPEHNAIFQDMRDMIHRWTLKLWESYVSCYIKKTCRNLKMYPFQFRIHMYNLHQIYINKLRRERHYVSKQIVIKYVNNLEPAALMYSINYHLRQVPVSTEIA